MKGKLSLRRLRPNKGLLLVQSENTGVGVGQDKLKPKHAGFFIDLI